MVAKQLETPLFLEKIPNALRKFDRWSPWRAQWNEKRGKWDKIPQVVDNLNYNLSTNKVKSWVSFDHVVKSLDLSKSAGLGFVMTGIKGLIAIDLDNCIGEQWAQDVIAMVNSYTEISPSGKGYRIFAFGDLDTDWNNHEVGIEVYGGNEARFLTVTGNVLNGSPGDVMSVHQGVFDRLAKLYAREKRKAEIIDLNMPDLIDDLLLPSTESLRIPAASLKFLLSGEFEMDRSGALFGVGVSLYAAGFSDTEVFSILANNDYAMEVALDHRRQDHDRALLYLWREHCVKAKGKGAAAIVTDAEFDVVESVPGEVELPNFKRDKNGQIEASIQNVTLALRRSDLCGMDIRHDRFRDEIMFTPHGVANAWRTFTDADYSRLRITLETGGFKPVGRELIRDVVLLVADDRPFDSAILWLDGLKWDGVSRAERFLEVYFGAVDSPYTRAVSMYIWTALAGRVMSPGIKADMVPILVGEQGAKKSSSVAAMAPNPDFFTEVSFHEKDEDLARKMRGRLIAEIGELRGLHTRELESIKAFITRTHENWVPKYREFATSFPRRLVFIGTTNQEHFLADDTGNRRWCPVRTSMADIDAIKRDRLQLWAEGRVWFELFGVAFQDAERLAQDVHDEHTITEPWADSVADWLDAPDALSGDTPRTREFLQVHEVARDCLHIEARNLKRVDQMQIGKILRAQGYEAGRVFQNGKQMRVWVKVKAN
jgi:predicted P-loop ATPase